MKANKISRPYRAQFYHKNRLPFAVAAAAMMLMATLNLALSWMIQQLVDTISGAPGARPLPELALMNVGLLLSIVVIKLFDYYSRPRFMRRAMAQYKGYAFQKLTEKSIASFHQEAAATYLSALSNDASSIEANYLEKQFELFSNAMFFFGALTMMLLYNPVLTAVAVGLAILPMIASVLAGDRLKNAERQVSDRNESFLAALKDSLSGFSVVKSFKAEAAIIKLFVKSNEAVEQAKCTRRKISTVLGTIGAVAGATAQLGVFLVGAYLAMSDKSLTPGEVIVFVNLMNFIIAPIAEVPALLANRKAAVALIDKLAGALEANVREQGEDVPRQLTQGIDVENVSFAYEADTPVLRGVSWRFQAGGSYAVVGASGSGKSTLLDLLMAAHSGYEGSIRYDGKELRQISSASLYDLVSIVQQNVFVFNASLRDNVTMFRDFPEAAVEKALALSGLSELVAARGGDFLCGENGSALSGGEKQRISIARSLLRRASVLLVDEATAALDAQTANQVSSAILALDGLTRIVITHRLEAPLLKRYDAILTLKAGRIVEAGSYEELMAKKGYFYSLYTVAQ